MPKLQAQARNALLAAKQKVAAATPKRLDVSWLLEDESIRQAWEDAGHELRAAAAGVEIHTRERGVDPLKIRDRSVQQKRSLRARGRLPSARTRLGHDSGIRARMACWAGMLAVMSDEPLPVSPPPLDPIVAPVPVAARPRAGWVVPLAAGVAGLIVGAGGVGLAWGLTGSGPTLASTPTSTAAATFTLTGTMEVAGATHWRRVSTQCEGTGGYDDIAEGTSVTVYSASGTVVGTGRLTNGVVFGSACSLSVVVEKVPVGADFFQVEVSHRGKLTLSAADAKAGKFAGSLG
ncbi:hypothetical protein ACFVH7_04365 [Kitasatospora indigofera]|uniref:hypothetical protein n=1 Tax=Kitasatospora indigofera TaxID=67307 RepID=UPI00362E8F2C